MRRVDTQDSGFPGFAINFSNMTLENENKDLERNVEECSNRSFSQNLWDGWKLSLEDPHLSLNDAHGKERSL